MKRLKWFLAFLLDAIIFTIVGILVTGFHLIVGSITIIMSMVKAIILFDGLYLLCCIITFFDLLVKYPMEAVGITFNRVKKSYDSPIILSKEEEND